ncbi:MAG: exo-alpha-sialidase [Candidatus Eremiobacteraeota bacterium]|nr:exo-alpha-sialidase [Candidatus Eremiobacteraeota bacterium]
MVRTIARSEEVSMFFALAVSAALFAAPARQASPAALSFLTPSPPITIGTDPLNFPDTENATAVGSVIATNGFTTVSIFQTGRFYGDASAGMGFTTATGGGAQWVQGQLPGLTRAQNAANPYDRVTFQTIAYDAKYDEFLVSLLPIVDTPSNGDEDTTLPPVVMRSRDGIHWTAPVVTSPGGVRPEKNYIACDNNRFSRYYGSCYVAWDESDNGFRFHVNASTDGGATWGPTRTAVDAHAAYGSVPVILPNGNVVITSEDGNGFDYAAANIISSVSTDGGTTWSAAYEVSPIAIHPVAAAMRTQPLPTSGVDSAGNVFTVWQDCRFRSGCSSNDLVMSTSQNGVNWTAPTRIALDAVTSGVDHFLPAISLRTSLLGTTIGLSYYEFPQANCTVSTCLLQAMFSNSGNQGASWSTPVPIGGAMNLAWLPVTSAGYMVGDYFSSAYPLSYEAPLALATAPNGAYAEQIEIVPWGGLSPGLFGVRAGASSGRSGIGTADDAALHRGAKAPAFRRASFAPRPHAATARHRSLGF